MVGDELAFEIELLPYHFLLPVQHCLDLYVVLEELYLLYLLELLNLLAEFPQTVEFTLLVLEVRDSS